MTWAPLLALPTRWLAPLLLAVLALLGTLVLHGFEVTDLAATVVAEERTRLLQRLALEQTSMEIQLGLGNPMQVRRVVSSLGVYPAISDAWLVDQQGQVIAALSRFAVGQPFATRLADQPAPLREVLKQALVDPHPAITITSVAANQDQAQALVARVPVEPNHTLLVRLDLDQPLAQRRYAARGQLWREALITLGFAVGLALLLHLLWSARVRRLTTVLAALGAGQLHTRVGLDGHDELALIGRAIDHMAGELEQLQAAQRESDARFKSIAEDTPLLICRYRPDLTIDYVNPAYCDYFGLHAEALVGTSFLRLIPEADRAAVVARIAALTPDAPLRTHEHPVLTPGGQTRWQRWSDRAVFDPHGRLIAYQAVGEDITERRRAEEALAISEARYREAQRVAHIGGWEQDLLTGQLWWSDETYRIFGIAPPDFGATYEAFLAAVHPDDRALVDQVFTQAVEQRQPYEIIHRLRLPDGGIKYVRERGEVHTDVDGQPPKALGTVQDVSELEEQVRLRTAELAAVNKELEMFSYSVSHDLKAPLRGIDGYSQLLLADYGERLDDEGRLFLNNVRTGVAQMNQLITDLLAYSRMERRALAPVALELATELGRVVQERAADIAARGLAIERRVAGQRVLADQSGLALVLRNLLDNALKFTRDAAMPRLSISAETSSECVTLCFADNGVGFDMRFHDQLFEVFSRLQRAEDYPGTGVGLAIVRKAVQRMGGRVWATGKPGEGARFFVELPR